MKLPNQFWLYGCLLAGAAWAHEPFESTATARLQHGRLEVVLTLSPGMAAALVRTGGIESEPTADYESYRAQIEEMAPGFLKVAAGGRALAPQRIAVRRNASAEPEIVYLFPAPPPGTLSFEAAYLHRLPPSYFSQLAVLDDDEKPLGKSLLVAEKAVAEIALAGPMPVATPVPGKVTRLPWWAVGAGIMAAALLWFLRRWRGPLRSG